MANKRMFSLQIVDTDAFLDMPQSSQLLYFHLVMRADDEGFIGSPKKIMRLIGSPQDDLKILITKRFILTFKSGIVVIKHWLIHNTIRMDRFNKTAYLDEKDLLIIKKNKAYTENGNQSATSRQHKLSKVKLSKDKLSKANDKNFGKKDVELTKLLYELIKENYPFILDKKTEQSFLKDYSEMNKMNRLDNRDYNTIEFIIRWCQEDDFWKQNIRSVCKLRKQFDNLLVRAKTQIDNKPKNITL